ncbi:MAG: NADH-quinone oxidoreductase subunit C [Deltaproteobacteria bacterium]|nr:NADH-quinone oxidoreductase subunit C [Deltaproteobacteria bacterium]
MPTANPLSCDALIRACRARAGHAVIGSHALRDDATVLLSREGLVGLATQLRDDPALAFDMLVDVTAVDFADYPPGLRGACSPVDADRTDGLDCDGLPRFEVVYHLVSLGHGHRLRLKVPIAADDLTVPTLCGVYGAANWAEREVWDMYGVRFDGHPDLRRILLYDEFEGHPLRKDYPLRGYQPLTALPTLAEYADHETHR